MRDCNLDGCERKHAANGLCSLHHQRSRKGKSLTVPPRQIGLTVEQRFWSKVDKTGGPDTCWIWTASRNEFGYGRINIAGRAVKAHRIAFEWAKGPIPDGKVVDHICHTPSCVNPQHLRLATPKQNGEHRVRANKNSASGVRGVHWDKREKKWAAHVQHHRKRICLGYFDAIDQAAEAIRLKRLELFTHNDGDRDEEPAA